VISYDQSNTTNVNWNLDTDHVMVSRPHNIEGFTSQFAITVLIQLKIKGKGGFVDKN